MLALNNVFFRRIRQKYYVSGKFLTASFPRGACIKNISQIVCTKNNSVFYSEVWWNCSFLMELYSVLKRTHFVAICECKT